MLYNSTAIPAEWSFPRCGENSCVTGCQFIIIDINIVFIHMSEFTERPEEVSRVIGNHELPNMGTEN